MPTNYAQQLANLRTELETAFVAQETQIEVTDYPCKAQIITALKAQRESMLKLFQESDKRIVQLYESDQAKLRFEGLCRYRKALFAQLTDYRQALTDQALQRLSSLRPDRALSRVNEYVLTQLTRATNGITSQEGRVLKG